MLGARVSTRPLFGGVTLEPLDLDSLLGVGGAARIEYPRGHDQPESLQLRDFFDFKGRTVLLATDGSAAAAAATHVALALAKEHGAVVYAVSVLDTRPAVVHAPLDLALTTADDVSTDPRRSRQIQLMRDALSATVGAPIDWPVRVIVGQPADAITQEAKRIRATMIVMGLRRHGTLDRVVHDETTLGVIRRARCPVLAVSPSMNALPTRVLAALDFGRSSAMAARRASALMNAGGSMLLAYVPPLATESRNEGESLIRELGIQAAFAKCEEDLLERPASVERVVLHHKLPQSVAKLLLEYAGATKADLVAAGSMEQRRQDRWLLGSVTTELVRDGRRSLLIVPPVGEPRDPWAPAS